VSTIAAPITLADVLPLTRWRTATLVVGAALFTAVAAQVRIPLGFTPVPVTGQTFAVLLVGAALGARRAMASQALYWVMAAVGIPVFSDLRGGWDVATGATAGYVVGFVIAAGLVGLLAERGQDRSFATSVPTMLLGSVVIYTTGVLWLSRSLDLPVYSAEGRDAFSLGLTPFIVGDLLKVVLAAVLTPAAWALVQRRSER
jgi:biotin transport system substrate-specific component